MSLLASASESESTESSEREPHEVYSSLLESELACAVTGAHESGTEWVLKHLLHWQYSEAEERYSSGVRCSQLPMADFHPHPIALPVVSKRCIINFPD